MLQTLWGFATLPDTTYMRKILILCLLAIFTFNANVFASDHFQETVQAIETLSQEAKNEQKYPFTLKPLPYTDNALEPFIDARTMSIHHNKHVKTYVDNLNKALESHLKYQDHDLEWLVTNVKKLPEEIQKTVQNNAGGVYNHNFFFAGMLKDTTLAHGSPLYVAITETFGSMDEFKKQFKNAALSQFGSGWAWLIADKDGALQIVTTPNQDTPLKHGKPILAVDVWEHSYYLKYQNKRNEYIDNWFEVVNWNVAEAHFAQAKPKK